MLERTAAAAAALPPTPIQHSNAAPSLRPSAHPEALCSSISPPPSFPLGGPAGVQVEALKWIEQHELEDTFYIVDLGNVQRMYKVQPRLPTLLPLFPSSLPCAAPGRSLYLGIREARLLHTPLPAPAPAPA